jgi:8-amino-7-oxononanoate synthase
MGVHGACVSGDRILKEYLVNFGRPFIYTTSLPPHSVVSIEASFEFLSNEILRQSVLQEKIEFFKKLCTKRSIPTTSQTAIQPVVIPGNEACRNVAEALQKRGFYIKAILAPTVKKGSERLRICLHTHNENEEIEELVDLLAKSL